MKPQTEVLLIGALGYIGSRLLTHLRAAGHTVTALDRAAPAGGDVLAADYRSLAETELGRFGTVVWLAGHSSVKMAIDAPADAFDNNVCGLLRLAQRLRPTQRLIYASSASLYSGNESPSHVITEEVIGFQYQNAYDLSKYAFDKLISTLGVNFCGLRFGTVCGTSVQQRHELLLNSMVRSAVHDGVVKVSNPQARAARCWRSTTWWPPSKACWRWCRRPASTTWPATACPLASSAPRWPRSWRPGWSRCRAAAPTTFRSTRPRSAAPSAARCGPPCPH